MLVPERFDVVAGSDFRTMLNGVLRNVNWPGIFSMPGRWDPLRTSAFCGRVGSVLAARLDEVNKVGRYIIMHSCKHSIHLRN